MLTENSLGPLFNPRSVALVGASNTEEKFSGVILKNLLGFRGRVYPINPRHTEIMGLKAYPSIAEIPEAVDLSVIATPSREVTKVLKEHKNKTKCAIIVSAGFAEIGEVELQNEIGRIAEETGIRILGPNCIGVFNPYRRLDTLFLSHKRLKRPKKGNIAVISQSGAVLICLFEAMRASNIGISIAANYGNAVDINESDLYDYLADDGHTDVVISYLESLADGRKFAKHIKMLSEKKPVIVLKSGKGPSGQAAAYSHTGRIAGRYEVFHSILKQLGIAESMDFDDLVDAAKAVSCHTRSSGNRVLIITNGGGSGVLAADECMRQGLDAVELPKDKMARLQQIFPRFYSIRNPLDLTAQVSDEDYLTALNELQNDYDGFIIIVLTGVSGVTARLGALMQNLKGAINKPIVFYVAQGGISKELISSIERAGMPVYPSPERAVKGIKFLLG